MGPIWLFSPGNYLFVLAMDRGSVGRTGGLLRMVSEPMLGTPVVRVTRVVRGSDGGVEFTRERKRE